MDDMRTLLTGPTRVTNDFKVALFHNRRCDLE